MRLVVQEFFHQDCFESLGEVDFGPGVVMMRFAFLGRVSAEDLQDPMASRQWQLSRAEALVAGCGRVVAEFFDVGLWVPEVGGPIDPDCEAHNLIMSVYAGMSKAERRRIQVRVRAAMIAQVEREGRFLGGRPPYGYRLAGAGPHYNPALAALGARRHRLEPDPRAAAVVERIFAMRIAGYGARRIARALDADDVSCPSAHDPARNRHRPAAGWTTGSVLAILGNPCYTGHEVWNKQSKTDVLIDPHNVSLGTRTMMRWNPRSEWVSSQKTAHPAIVNADDFERAQHAHAIRGARRTYLLRGLLRCALCGHRMEGTWNNGQNRPCAALENIEISTDVVQQVAVCRRLGLALRYDHLAETLAVEGPHGDVSLRLM